MANLLGFLERAAVSGTVASITSGFALAAAARIEGKGALQPINATSHWLHRPGAAEVRTRDAGHTGVGYATHHAATLFWAVLFEAWIARRRPLAPLPLARDTAVMAGVAAAVDYLATPKQFTPGWEFVLSKRAMGLVYAAMGAGLALGVLAVDRGIKSGR